MQKFIIQSQVDDIVQLLFRHDLHKRNLAKQIVAIITLGKTKIRKMSQSTGSFFSQTLIHLNLQTVRPIIEWTTVDEETIPSASFRSLTPPPKSNFEVDSKAQLSEVSMLSHFDPCELGNLFQWITQIHNEYAGIFDDLRFNLNFPTLNDHFDDPKNLRGCLADTKFIKSASAFNQLLTTADRTLLELSFSSQSVESNKCEKLPTVLCSLITDYLPFPPASCTN